MNESRVVGVIIAVAAFSISCAGAKAHRKGTEAAQRNDLDRAVLELRHAVRQKPRSVEFRGDLRSAEMKAGQRHLELGHAFHEKREFDAAILEFQLALAADPLDEEIATQLIVKVQRERDADAAVREARGQETSGSREGAVQAARRALSLDPHNREAQGMLERLHPVDARSLEGLSLPTKPFTLKFSNTHVREAFEVFSQMSGVNFVLDEALKDDSITLLVQDASFETAFELLLAKARLGAKVLGSASLVVYPDTKEKRKQYAELQVETFYLENMRASAALNLLRSVLDVKGGYINEELNTLVLRDTPAALSVARRVLDANDLAPAEVLLDIEMLEIDRGKLMNLGVDLGDQASASFASDPTNTGTALTLDTLTHRFSARNVLITLPNVVVNLRREDTDAKILANPRIRVLDSQQAVIHIGERVPFVTVSTLNTVVSENIQFQDVGIKMTVTPSVHRDDSLTLKLGLEVSSLGPATSTASGNTVFRIGTRNATTVLHLRDGETQVLGGLIQDEERNTTTRVPGFGDIPVIGALFSNHNRSHSTTDILLFITPRLVRSMPTLARADALVWAGREDDIRPLRDSSSPAPTPQPTQLPGGLQLDGPRRLREGDTGRFVLAAPTGGPALVEFRYEPSALTFVALEAGGHRVEPVQDETQGVIRWSAPENAGAITISFRAAHAGASTVRFLVKPASQPGASPADAIEGATTILTAP